VIVIKDIHEPISNFITRQIEISDILKDMAEPSESSLKLIQGYLWIIWLYFDL